MLVLSLGVQMSADILTQELSQNMQAALMAHNGSKTEDNGQTGTMNLHPAQLSSLTGKATVLLTIPVLFRSVRTEQFIQSKVIPETLAEQERILLEVLLSMDTVFRHIKKDGYSFE